MSNNLNRLWSKAFHDFGTACNIQTIATQRVNQTFLILSFYVQPTFWFPIGPGEGCIGAPFESNLGPIGMPFRCGYKFGLEPENIGGQFGILCGFELMFGMFCWFEFMGIIGQSVPFWLMQCITFCITLWWMFWTIAFVIFWTTAMFRSPFANMFGAIRFPPEGAWEYWGNAISLIGCWPAISCWFPLTGTMANCDYFVEIWIEFTMKPAII